MTESRALRADARRNVEKLLAAAREVFCERGLGAPLDAVAARAGVSIGTLYNRFPTREALIDAALPELVACELAAVAEQSLAEPTPWRRFASLPPRPVRLANRRPRDQRRHRRVAAHVRGAQRGL